MLKKIHRLSSVRLKNPKNIRGAFLSLKISKNDMGYSRFGVVISKKIDKRAVARNSLKRKLSLSIEEIFDRIENGVDVVIYPSAKTLEKSQIEISEEIEAIFTKENLLK